MRQKMSSKVKKKSCFEPEICGYLFAPKEGVHAPRRKSSFRRVQKLKLTVVHHMNCKIPEDQLEDRFFKWGEGFLNLLLWDPFEGARPRLSVPVEKENAARLYQHYTGPFGSNKLRAEVARTLQVGRRLSSS
ncbi:unnamed protein product [Nesidiocoris tenuis]|uniref:Uncharacterized protein n=1 Tax=Nesidiocoris tenuis TaxID=355587 RepID=A0A6H5GWD2_9HEMI|nr:unnamed protein product [Nesidiocoris tenuis]